MSSDTPTLEGVSRRPPARWGRRLGAIILLIVVVAGATGFLGARSRTVTATGGGYRMQVVYPKIARAGLDVPFRVRVHRDGGLPSNIVLAISPEYFRMFETQGFYPDASSVTNDGQFVYFTFSTKANSDNFLWDADIYIQPASQIGRHGTVALVIDRQVVAKTTIHTWLLP